MEALANPHVCPTSPRGGWGGVGWGGGFHWQVHNASTWFIYFQNSDEGNDILISRLLFKWACSTQELVSRVDDYLSRVVVYHFCNLPPYRVFAKKFVFKSLLYERLLSQKVMYDRNLTQSSRDSRLVKLHNRNTTQQSCTSLTEETRHDSCNKTCVDIHSLTNQAGWSVTFNIK